MMIFGTILVYNQNNQMKKFRLKVYSFIMEDLINRMLSQDGDKRPDVTTIQDDEFFTKYIILQD
jgi:hypothetical protein